MAKLLFLTTLSGRCQQVTAGYDISFCTFSGFVFLMAKSYFPWFYSSLSVDDLAIRAEIPVYFYCFLMRRSNRF